MSSCVEEIAGKLYRWNVPQGFTKEGSKKLFFFTPFGQNVEEKKLDENGYFTNKNSRCTNINASMQDLH